MNFEKYKVATYETPGALAERVERYFEDMARLRRPYTVAGLLLYCQLTKRALAQFEGTGADCFREIMEWAYRKIELQRNEMLLNYRGNPSGLLADLRVNHGWREDAKVNIDAGGMRVVVEMAGGGAQVKAATTGANKAK